MNLKINHLVYYVPTPLQTNYRYYQSQSHLAVEYRVELLFWGLFHEKYLQFTLSIIREIDFSRFDQNQLPAHWFISVKNWAAENTPRDMGNRIRVGLLSNK